MTRFCKIKGFRGFIGGKDNDNIFEEGIIYEVKKILGEIIITPIGKSTEFNKGGVEISKQSLFDVIREGDYLNL